MHTWSDDDVERSPFGVVRIDEHARVLQANGTFLRLAGRTVAQVVDEPVERFVVPRDREAFLEALDQLRTESDDVRVEHRLDGRDGPVWCRTVLVRSEAGRLLYVQDISHDRLAVLRLRETERQYRHAFEHAPVGQAICSIDGRILRANTTLARTLGRDVTELLGGRLEDHALDPAELEDHELEALVRGSVPSLRLARRLRHADGSTVHADVHLTLRRDRSGQPAELLLAVDDVTRRVMAERERAQAQAQLVAAMEDIERSNADLEDFASVASHDLRTPLTSVVGFLQTLDRQDGDRLSETGRACLDAASRGAERMQRMVASLLEYAGRRRGAIETEPVDLGDVLDGVLTALDPEIQRSGATVSVGPLPTIQGDRHALDAVVQNLVSNALKFQREGHRPTVLVTGERVGETWQLVVEDHGIGVPEGAREAIFERFSRPGTDARFDGTGIGLATVARAVDRHGGRVWVEPVHPHGSRFVVSLPDAVAPPATARPADHEQV